MSDEHPRDTPSGPKYVKVTEGRPDGAETGCLRPLDMCDLGGCCDICWYGQNNTGPARQTVEGETSPEPELESPD